MKKIFKYLGGGKMKSPDGNSEGGVQAAGDEETPVGTPERGSAMAASPFDRTPSPVGTGLGDLGSREFDDIPVDDFVPVEGLPPDKTMLSSQTMDELTRLCEHVNVDHSSFTTREEYVDALQARYPKEKMSRSRSLCVSDVSTFLQSGVKAQENNIKVDDLFKFLLNKLKVERDLQRKIIKVYSTKEKVCLLGECVSILDDDQNFTERDEDLIQRLFSTKSIDSIHILAIKYRVQHSHEEWRQYFTAAGGLSVLVTIILNSTDTVPLLDFDAAALYEVMLCLKIFIKSDGIKSVSETRGAIDAMCLALDFNHNFLVVQILELLSVITAYGGEDAIWQVAQGLHHLAKVRHEKPFACFAAAMIERSIDIQVAVVSFINTFLMSMKDLEERITVRGHLYSAKFNQVLEFLVVLGGDETVVGFSDDMTAALLDTMDRPDPRLARAVSAESTKPSDAHTSTRLQLAYEQKYGRTRSVDSENRMLMGEGLAEDGTTAINPSHGVMAGYCFESKKHKEGVKRRWYCLKDNMFKWYHPEKKINGLKGEKENGSISIVDVQEILEYSTAGNLQNISRCGFVIKTNKAAPEDRYQIGVEDDLTKRRWITALRSAHNNVMSVNAAFRVRDTRMSAKDQKSAADKLKKHINVFNLVESEDLGLIRDECNNLSYLTSNDDWNDVASIVRYLCFEIISTGHQDDLKDILQNIISLYDQYRRDHQRYVASTSMGAKKYATISNSSELHGHGSKKKAGVTSNDALVSARQTAQLAAAVAASKIASRTAANVGASAVVEAVLPPFGRRRSISTLTYRLSTRMSIGNSADMNASHDAAIDLWSEEDNALPVSKKDEIRQRQERRKKSVQHMHAKNDEVEVVEEPAASTSPVKTPEVEDGKSALMAMIAARGPRLPPPPVQDDSAGDSAGAEPDGKSALMSMIANRGPRLPPPPAQHDSVGDSAGAEPDGKSALMSMIANRGARLPPPPPRSDVGSAANDGEAKKSFSGFQPRAVPKQSEAELKRIAEEEEENAKYPAKAEFHPSRKMRSLFWTKMKPSEAASTIWSSVPDVELEADELESLFCDEKAVVKNAVKTIKAGQNSNSQVAIATQVNSTPAAATAEAKEKLKNVALFDSKRTQNVAIGIKKLRMIPPQIVEVIIKMDPSELTKEVTNTLILLAPSATEIAVIQGYGGTGDELDLVGQLFYEMLRVPRVAQRLEIMKSSHEWMAGYEQLLDEVNTLTMAVSELATVDTKNHLQRVFGQTLAAGNYLNAGTARARAHGAKLDILLKLANLKQNGNPKATLLHYIVEKSSGSVEELPLFYSTWSGVWNAPRVNSRQLEADMRALAGDINIMKTEKARFTSAESSFPEHIREPLVSRITSFLATAEPKLHDLQTKCTAALKKVAETRAQFGDVKNPEDGEDACCSFFGLLVTFAEMYARAKSDIDAWNVEAEKKRRIADKKKAKQEKLTMSPGSTAREQLIDDTSTSQADLNVFDRLRESQSQDPVSLIATFQHGMVREASEDSDDSSDSLA